MQALLRKTFLPLGLVLVLGLLLTASQSDNFLTRQGWGLVSLEVVVIILALFYCVFEQGQVSSRQVAVIAVMGAIAALGRLPLAALPGIQPTTFIVIVSGFILGPRAGFMIGSTAALVSNFFLGQGPWTPWQMLAWGLAGISAGGLKKLFPGIGDRGLLVFCGIWGYLFGWMMNLWTWTAFISPLSWHSLVATCAASFWFDTLHAAGNAGFYLVFGPVLVRVLKRYQKKLKVETYIEDHHRDFSL